MKRFATVLTATMVMLIGSAYTIQAIINWKINSEKAMVKFSMNAHGQELIGNFKGAKGDIKFDENDLANSSINCTIDISTINTGIEARDGHLQKKGFFDAVTFPTGKFTSTKIEKTSTGYNATGNFTLKQTTKSITIPFTYDDNGNEGNFKGSFTIKRSDYGIGQPDEDIGDDVTISLDIPVVKGN
ncbi:MAG TPA: YceI family protein [Ferruginibacter sp.]|nr:YceI family protein [Ferruginibacter sp.]